MRWPLEALWEQVVPFWPGFTAEVLPELDSTNSELMRRARSASGATSAQCDPVLLVAVHQTAGRGRLGRTWMSGPSATDLTFSLGFPWRLGAGQDAPLSGLSLLVGLAVARSLHPSIRLKWPNDLWWNARKLGGILIETTSLAREASALYVVVGVGLNISPRSSEGLHTPAACLQELMDTDPLPGICVPTPDAAGALLRVVPELVQAIEQFRAQGFAPFVDEFLARDALAGLEITVRSGASTGAQTGAHMSASMSLDNAAASQTGEAGDVTGLVCGVNAEGALLIKTPLGLQEVRSSEVTLRSNKGEQGAG
ncbi:MAG: biotin--[acetyl-CoA-carboxylase] ligase [Betaproteobacteria bacterium]|nr:biotin--[acetyl-CoA-carboxylase] ligase [Betaproteobacteria bacterium]NBY72076.1 biotin--[acetyl-CoA-carboxylase] ligase [Betaproteobacteria bacterium]